MNTRSSTSTSTETLVETTTEDVLKQENKILLLKLKKKTNIKWSNTVIDNENMNKKNSKKCCIYHKRKAFGESDSDESESDTEIAKSKPSNKLKALTRFHA